MIVECIRYRTNTPDALIAGYKRAMAPLMRSPYSLWCDVAHCVEEPECVIVRIHWTSADDHPAKFRASEEFREFLGHIKSWIPDIEEMRHSEQVAVSAA